jgi:uncharacterized membrane protein YdjX (TVP38/TMEM64 family)
VSILLESLQSLLGLGYFGIFIFALAVNLIPFFGPSNLVIAGAVGTLFPSSNPVFSGLTIALGSSIAKTVHFGLSFLGSDYVKKRRPNAEVRGKSRYLQYAMLALFLAAASPIPDEPIVIPLGLARYSPIRFFIAFFSGKAIITVAGALLGQRLGSALEGYLSHEATIVISVLSTIILTILILKKDTIVKKLKSLRTKRSLS